MHKNIIFDCGRVLFKFSREHLLDVFIGQNKEDRALINKYLYENWSMQDLGMECNEFYNFVVANLPEHLHKGAHDIIFRWDEEFQVNFEMEKLIKKLKENGKNLYLLSNMPSTFSYHHERLDMLKYFDDLVFSYPLKMAKPDPRIYEYLLNKHSLNPNDCLFIDDSEENVKAGEKLGIKGYIYNPEDFESFKKYIEDNEL